MTSGYGHPREPDLPAEGFFSAIELRRCSAPRHIVLSLLELAIEVAREGREGRKVGTMFVLGDEKAVLDRSRCLILDPLAGHPRAELRLESANLRETIKELSQLDGGFVVTDRGEVISGARYFDASLEDVGPMLGLGSRHIAGASISRSTDALAVVVSESGIVRLFEGGDLVAEILPELWLLQRFSSRVPHARSTTHPLENVAVLTEAATEEPGS